MADNSGYSITHSVPAAMLAKLGDVLTSFGLVEQSLKHLVGALESADPNIGAVVIAEAPTRGLRWMAASLYRVHFGEDAQFAELVALINEPLPPRRRVGAVLDRQRDERRLHRVHLARALVPSDPSQDAGAHCADPRPPASSASRARRVLTIYWVTGTAASSSRIYLENHRAMRPPDPSSTLTGVTVLPKDFFLSMPRFARRDNWA